MTKVRTILAEFCSPKEIQAINRMGLIKKEERESQPIPWRHRLSISERRELVFTEMKMSLTPASRETTRDKTKVVDAARNSMDSKMGECLLNKRIRRDVSLVSKIGRLNREEKRLAVTHEQAKEMFIKKSRAMNHEPLLLVERPPLDHTILFNQQDLVSPAAKMPGYMRPLKAQSKIPSTLTSIEAFTMEPRKKRNVWEEVLEEKETPKFKSATMPSIRLTEHETELLKYGRILHKPSQKRIAGKRSHLVKDKMLNRETTRQCPSVFITQLPQKD